MADQKNEAIESKLLAWLGTEGYPLEFTTARAFRKSGFSVWQGYYTHPREKGEASREIDIVAYIDAAAKTNIPELRVVHVVECKWTGDKPWIVFCGGHGMTTAACATQTMGSELGETLLWKDAGGGIFSKLGIFHSPNEPAFGGRQAFSGSRDVLFDAMRSVVGSARSIADEYNEPPRRELQLPEFGVVDFQ